MMSLTVMRWHCTCGKVLSKNEVQDHRMEYGHQVPIRGVITTAETIEKLKPQTFAFKPIFQSEFTGSSKKDYPNITKLFRAIKKSLTI